MDSLLSIVQMPGGIPVGTLAIGKAGATNAALLAIAILATTRPELREKLRKFREEQTARRPRRDAAVIVRSPRQPCREFLRTLVEPFLLAHEAENCFFLGSRADADRLRRTSCCSLRPMTPDRVAAVALMTPWRHMVMTRGPADAAVALAGYLHEHSIVDLPGMQSPREFAEAFARRMGTPDRHGRPFDRSAWASTS